MLIKIYWRDDNIVSPIEIMMARPCYQAQMLHIDADRAISLAMKPLNSFGFEIREKTHTSEKKTHIESFAMQ